MRSQRSIGAAVVLATLSLVTAVAARAPAGATSAVGPQRVLDTRNGVGSGGGRLAPGQTIVLPLPVPGGTSSVTLNLTVTEAEGAGYLTAWPCGEAPPATSILNFVPGQSDANALMLGYAGGAICLAVSAPVHVVADLMAHSQDPSEFQGSRPERLVDTRLTGARLRAGEEGRIAVAGAPGIPSGAPAAALNVTVVDPAGDGYVTVYPCGSRPLASTANYRAGDIVPAFTVVPLSAGDVCLFSHVDTDVVVDVFGWSSAGGNVRLQGPNRLLDTRTGFGWAAGPARPGAPVVLRAAGRAGVPNDAAAALVTITVTGGQEDGYLTAWPCDQPQPHTSVLNLRPGLLRSNLALVGLAGDGTLCLGVYTGYGTPVDVVVDAVGWLTGGPDRPAPPPDAPPSGTLPPGSALPGDAACAARVAPAGEVRPQNAGFNETRGHPLGDTSLPTYARVTGNFVGTTDEIIQWTACKWGIEADIVRAQVAKESYWVQSSAGDFTTNPADCAPGHPIRVDGRPGQCPESIGLMQVRTPYMRAAINDAAASSAYNLDVAYAVWRACYEGQETWLNTVDRGATYGAGDVWGCVGRWFAGRWYTDPARQYIADVQSYLAQRTWTDPGFINYR